VYGVGYGLQLGFGAVTIISAATLYALAAAIVAIASVPVGALIGAVFGLARGATLFMARSVDSPSDLMAFHRRLASRRAVGVWSAITGDVAIAIGAGLAAFGAVR
jgi:hypothetical protein